MCSVVVVVQYVVLLREVLFANKFLSGYNINIIIVEAAQPF